MKLAQGLEGRKHIVYVETKSIVAEPPEKSRNGTGGAGLLCSLGLLGSLSLIRKGSRRRPAVSRTMARQARLAAQGTLRGTEGVAVLAVWFTPLFCTLTLGLLKWINYFDEWKAVKVSVTGINLRNSMFFHQNSRMHIKNEVSSNMGQFVTAVP